MKQVSRIAFVLAKAFLCIALFAPNSVGEQWPASCGPKDEAYDLTIERAVAPEPSAPSEHAAVYFLTKLSRLNRASYMVAIDGKWVGALRGDSYFRTTALAGIHHACLWVKHMRPTLLELNLAAGKTYYVRGHWLKGFARANIGAELINPDEGAFLVSTSKRSTITRRK